MQTLHLLSALCYWTLKAIIVAKGQLSKLLALITSTIATTIIAEHPGVIKS